MAKELRADERTRTMPIIAVTSYALSGDEPRAFESGCDDYVSKPYRPKILLEHVSKYLEGASERARTPRERPAFARASAARRSLGGGGSEH